jgi:hypothetical protein
MRGYSEPNCCRVAFPHVTHWAKALLPQQPIPAEPGLNGRLVEKSSSKPPPVLRVLYRKVGLDLDDVARLFETGLNPIEEPVDGGDADWLGVIARANPLLGSFSASGWTASPDWSPKRMPWRQG